MTDIVWKTTRLPDALVGAAYEASLAVTGNATAFTAASVSSGALPSSGNLVLNADHVRITGTPKRADLGTYTFKITLTDTAGGVQSGTFTLVVRNPTDADAAGLDAAGQRTAADFSRAWPLG